MNSTLPPGDNERTVMLQGDATRSLPVMPEGTEPSQNALPIGTTLDEFEITGVIGEGGFGIVYLAYDHSLQRQIALKEYMPSTLASRGAGAAVTIRSERHAETFQAGLRSFINEARLLAQFDHPSLVKVYRFWESNGTAYMVMPFYQGRTLKETLSLMSSPPDEPPLKQLLMQLLDALEVIHNDHCLHRDIAPDNILILPSGRPILLDFGAARRVISNMTQSLTVILKPGYAPVEQYADVTAMKQGAWTDIYALAAVAYFAITGQAPMPSVGRMISDSLVPLSKAAMGRYSPRFLEGLDRALAVKPDDRPKTVGELRVLLGLAEQHRTEQSGSGEPPASPASRLAKIPAEVKKGKAVTLYIGVAILLAIVIGAGLFISRDQPVDTHSLAGAALDQVSIVVKQFDPLNALDEIFERRDRYHAVTVSAEKAQARIGADPLRFRIRSAKNGYVYLLMVGTNRTDFFLLFPNAVDKDNLIKSGEELDLPRSRWKMIADGPRGTNHFVVIVSEHPRDFSAAGLRPIDPFAEFPSDQAARLYRAYTGLVPLFAGKAICPQDSTPNCTESYGAAVFSIEEIDA